MRELVWELAPEKPGDNDSNESRIRRWEEMNPGIRLKDLSEEECVDVLAWVLVIPKNEARTYMTHLRTINV